MTFQEAHKAIFKRRTFLFVLIEFSILTGQTVLINFLLKKPALTVEASRRQITGLY